MKNSIWKMSYVLFSILLVTACSPDSSEADLTNEDQIDLLLGKDGMTIIDDTGLAIQNFSRNPNSNQTDEELIRGTRITIPLFDESPVDIRVGRWGTVAFSIVTSGVDSELCNGAVSEEDVNDLLESAIAFLEDNNVVITFDGQELDIAENFRPEGLTFQVDDVTGECVANLPWRYYQNPRPPGDYELVFSIGETSFSRTVSWKRPNQ